MRKIVLFIILAFTLYGYFGKSSDFIQTSLAKSDLDNTTLANAYRNHKSNIQVSGSGRIIRILADDTNGRKHQKFILQIASGQTLLISHNIDLASRIDSLSEGDTVDFFGEYEWNSKGGVIHWTHHDPGGHHISGWLKHNGTTYQ